MYIMMKRSTRRLITILAVSLVVLAGIWVVKNKFNLPEVKGKTLLTYIPGNFKNKPLIAVVGVNKINKIYKQLKATNFFKAFEESKLYNQLLPGDILFEKIIKFVNGDAVGAVYGKKPEASEYIIISKLRDKISIKALIFKTLSNSGENKQIYKEVEICGYSDENYFAFEDRFLMVSSSINLLKDVIDIYKHSSKSANFNTLHAWVEDKIDSSADGFVFTSNTEVVGLINEAAQEKLKFRPSIRTASVPFTYHEFTIDKGVFIKSYSKYENGKVQNETAVPFSINFLPARLLVGSLNTDFKMAQGIKDLASNNFNMTNFVNFEFKEELADYFGREFGYAILGPSPEIINLALPGLVLFGEVKDGVSRDKLDETIDGMFNLKMRTEEHAGVKYKYAQIPVFMGQMIELCAVNLKVKNKRFIIITSSRKITQDIIDLALNKNKSFRQSPAWRELSSFLPKKYSLFSYADFNALASTVGLFIAALKRDKELENFLETRPFSWVGPTGSASIFERDSIIVHTYAPVLDLTLEKWQEILEALKVLII